MKPFELRLAEHHARNARHLKNLQNFVQDPARFSRLPEEEQELIKVQIEEMERLDAVLRRRMQLHQIPV